MNSSHSSPNPPADALPPPAWPDDDLALGCECANPALQIERWGQESAQPTQELC